MGWVDVRRDHGKLIFIDLRDRSGKCQVVFIGKDKVLYEKANQLRSEWGVTISGQVNARPEKLVNPNLATGEYEVLAEGLEISLQTLFSTFERRQRDDIAELADFLSRRSIRDARLVARLVKVLFEG